jgi:hypothetical protein
MYAHANMCVCVLTQTCVYVSSHKHVCMCAHTNMCVCFLTQTCVYVCSHKHVCMCAHTNMSLQDRTTVRDVMRDALLREPEEGSMEIYARSLHMGMSAGDLRYLL